MKHWINSIKTKVLSEGVIAEFVVILITFFIIFYLQSK